MRGYSKTPRVSQDTFLILDRLYGTLDDKIEMWSQMSAATKGCCGGSDKSPEMLNLLNERLLLAYDLSSAINYLHGVRYANVILLLQRLCPIILTGMALYTLFSRLLYRDIKPENIGFDIRGDVKLFDFGLCKSLEQSKKILDGYGYNLTAKTGSVPYMAPEIALGKPYDKEVDVYSFSILLWEIIGLEWAFNGFDAREYFVQVCARNLRLPVERKWPAMVRVIIQEGWDPKPEKRPSMKRIGVLLRAELEDMISDSAIRKRDEQMLNKSKRSARGIIENSRSRRMNGSIHRRSSALGARSVRHMFVQGDVCGKECDDCGDNVIRSK